MILGFVGTYAAGKDAAADYLVEKYGFMHVSTGNLVREIIQQSGLGGLDRQNLQKVANDLRQKHGHGHLVHLALEKEGLLIVSGLRNPGEAAVVKEAGGILVAFDAPHELRWERAKKRGRIDDALSLEEFKQQQAVEEGGDKHVQNISAVVAMADYHVNNDGQLNHLHQKLDALLQQIKDAQG